MSRPPKKRRSTTPTSNTIAFRAPEELLTQIDKAAKPLGATRGELVRAIVATHFESQPAAMAEDLAKLMAKTSLIQRNQARLLVTLLTTVANISLADAKEIARTTLLN